ncbi:bacteriocin biosynthesis protein [Pseudoalteromonas phenolica]|uniref:Bacteriocin biosynthesis protein n=1 Tax=Pseudoalteromonas phenolica TaxID=161398 RepID=A0A5S3YTD4_9GAMM|nr:YcaO-like family protein [Pseudoalteromonas phenolica]TMP80716.1 bacteriocin biosynthesis protein [Pseudoalteromonas phenolica]
MVQDKDILFWHENYNIHLMKNNDLIAISGEKELLLSHADFPLFHLINGKSSLKEIASSTSCQKKIQKFFFLVNKFIGDLITIHPPVITKPKKALEYQDFNLYFFHYKEYENLIQRLHSSLESDFKDISFIYSSDFYSLASYNFSEPLQEREKICLVEVNGNTISISPLFEKIHSVQLFLNKLSSNKPVIKFLGEMKEEVVTIPYAPPLEMSCYDDFIQNKFNQLVHTQRSCSELKLLEYKLDSKSVSKHCYIPISSPKNKDSQAEIKLASRPNYNCQDGGSRTVAPEVTVSLLSKFVGPKTGEITHIEEITPYNGSPISIFRTAFFKNPSIHKEEAITNKSFVQVCLGKGVSKIQSMASALCETIERKNAQFSTNIKFKLSKPEKLNYKYLNFGKLNLYSESQYKTFSCSNNIDELQNVTQYQSQPIHWQPVWSLSHNETVYVPSVLCFANTPFEDDKFGKWQSNGCAAGNNLEEAILQALFELIERDATAIWWYNKLERPSFDLTLIAPDYLNPLHVALDLEHEYWVLDLTVDTGVPAMAAIGRHKQNKGFIFGFGCHLKPEMAAQRALTELCQLIPIRNQNGAPFDFDAIKPESYLFPNNDSPRGEYSLAQTYDIKEDILTIVEKLKTLNLETLALDYSRPPIPISTAKVFVPGLCHIWPQLGNKRLYDTPVRMGWRQETLNEQTINQQGLYI